MLLIKYYLYSNNLPLPLPDDLIKMIGFSENKSCYKLMTKLFENNVDYKLLKKEYFYKTLKCDEKIGTQECVILKQDKRKKKYYN